MTEWNTSVEVKRHVVITITRRMVAEREIVAEDLIDFMQYIQISHNTVYTLIIQVPATQASITAHLPCRNKKVAKLYYK
jgi:hypothetical protein